MPTLTCVVASNEHQSCNNLVESLAAFGMAEHIVLIGPDQKLLAGLSPLAQNRARLVQREFNTFRVWLA